MANVMRKREMLMLMLMATSFVQLGVCIDEEARTLSEVRELSYSNLRADAGINHQAWNFRTMLVEALITNRTLVLPIFFLHRDHNHGIQIHTQLDDYFDIQNIRCDGEHIGVQKAFSGEGAPIQTPWTTNLMRRYRRAPMVLKNLEHAGEIYHMARDAYPGLAEYLDTITCDMPPHPSLQQLAIELRKKYFKDGHFIHVHVRRGDKWWTFNCTTGFRIAQVLHNLKVTEGTSVFIATNERDISILTDGLQDFNPIFASRIPELASLQQENNYKAYIVEKTLGEWASIHIGTFSEDTNAARALCPNVSKAGPGA